MSLNWFTYHSHPHKEDYLCRQLESLNLEYYYPCLKVKPVNPRSRKIRPYFPGYLFIHADLAAIGLTTLQYMPYSTGLVKFGGEPAGVPDELINSIRKRLELINLRGENALQNNFKQGDPVVIAGGIFDGYEGLFDETLSGNERSRILLKTLNNYALKVEVPNINIKNKNII